MNGKTALVILLAVFLSHCCSTRECGIERQGDRWVPLGMSEKGSAYYYDPLTMSAAAEGIVAVWVKVVPSEDESIHTILMALVREGFVEESEEVRQTRQIAYSCILYEVDCRKQSIIPSASQDYDNKGNILYSCANEKEIVQLFMHLDSSIAPGSIWAVLSRTVCETQWREARFTQVCR